MTNPSLDLEALSLLIEDAQCGDPEERDALISFLWDNATPSEGNPHG